MTISDETMELIMDQATAETRTALPGVIKEYDPDTQTCKVRPVIDTPVKDPDTGEVVLEEQPTIPNCPVAWESSNSASASITFPLSPGDECLIIWCEKAVDAWMSKGGDGNEPVELRQHDDSDAIVFPVLRSLPNALDDLAVDGDSIVIRAGSGTEIKFVTSGDDPEEVALAPRVSERINELLDKVEKMVTAFNGHTHQTPAGPSSPPTPQQSTPPDTVDSDFYKDGEVKST
jgi:hypothetical protein